MHAARSGRLGKAGAQVELSGVDPHSVLLLGALGALAIVVVTALAPRTGVAAPLILVMLGVATSFLPAVPAVVVAPEWILAGVLPPLLYSSAVSLPTMDFRRDFTAIGALSVALVVVSAVLLGQLFTWLIPGLGLPLGIALGAILSPTDAVATTIVKRLDASPRVVTVLEGESLLNDASALVLLNSAIAAVATTVSLGEVAASFVWAAAAAAGVGLCVGLLGLFVRARLGNAALSTAVSFVVPFLAYTPAERIHASGLVAVVVAGLVTGNGAAKYLRPQDRFAEESNWRTVELLLEGGVFLLMGLELYGLVEEVRTDHGSVTRAVGIATFSVVVILAVRAAFVVPLLRAQKRRAERGLAIRERIAGMGEHLDVKLEQMAAEGRTAIVLPPAPADEQAAVDIARLHGASQRRKPRTNGPAAVSAERAGRWRETLRRRTADIDYLTAEPLGWREGTLLVWAGMRGVVTLAAAQSLPEDTTHRALLVLVAFTVAAGTLLVQGSSLPWLVRRLGLAGASHRSASDRMALRDELDAAAAGVVDDPELRRADGTEYHADVVTRVRADVIRATATPSRTSSARSTGSGSTASFG